MSTLTLKEKESILDLLKEGMSIRAIARHVLGRESRESTIRDFINSLTKGTSSESTLKLHQPKILLLDIETAPTKAYVWKRWKENISQDQVISEGFILCYGAKWLGENNLIYQEIPRNCIQDEYDLDVVMGLWELIDKADIIIGHNAKNFDIATINARFAAYELPPTSSYKIIDTLQIAKKNFRFPSNRLDSLGEYLGVGRKVENGGFKLWRDCLVGDDKAWELMQEYNLQDVELLEDVYLRLRAWDKTHPNVGLYNSVATPQCPCCGSINLEVSGHVYTGVSKFEEYTCTDCGKRSRGRKNKFPKEKMEFLLTNAI